MIIFESILDGFADIRNNLGRTLLQLTGVILGVGSIVATFALAAAGKEMSQRFYKVSGGIEKIFIRNKPLTKVSLDAKSLAAPGLTFGDVTAIQQQAKHIDLVSPSSRTDMTVRYLGSEKKYDISGVTPAYAPMSDLRAETGRFITDLDIAQAERVVVLGSKRARQIFSTDQPVGKTITMNGTGYLVVGVLEEKYFSWDQERNGLEWMNEQILIPITTMMVRQGQSLREAKVSSMQARMRDVKVADEAVKELDSILMREHGVKDFEVFSRVDRLRRNQENDKMYDITFMVCGLISLFVGGIVIMNIQLASFNERVREVGTRKAVGASSIHIFIQFMVESLLVAGFGGAIGLLAGRAFTSGISMLTKNSATITPQVIMTALIFAAGTGLIFGLYPAIKASRLHPIEALRTE